MHRSPGAAETRSQRWLARLSLLLACLAVIILVVFAGLKSFIMLAVALAGAVVTLTAAYFFLSRRGVVRWVSAVVVVLAPIAVIVAHALAGLLWVAILAVAVWVLAGVAARLALAGDRTTDWRMPEYPAQQPAAHPFLIMNPKSGGGKVGRFDLKRKAEGLGAEVFLMDGPEEVDVAAVARDAVARGADLLGVAGGDGTQALVAGVAAEHGIPFVVITAGTRNHFALDLGLDREDPSACLDALSDGVELHVDLGTIGGQTFVNNASFGAYAEVVQTPAYRDDKMGTTLELLPDLLQGHNGARLRHGPTARGSRRRRRCWWPTTPTAWATWPAWAAAPGWTSASSAWSASMSAARRRPRACSAAARDRGHRADRAAESRSPRTRPRSRSASTARPCRCLRRCCAPSTPARCASGCRDTGRESRRPSPR